jgi:hypothetical protein
MSDARKVWVAVVDAHDEWGIGPCEVLIEQFGDSPPTVAFRRDNNFTGDRGVWGRPWRGVVAP